MRSEEEESGGRASGECQVSNVKGQMGSGLGAYAFVMQSRPILEAAEC
jgi:hypothetical protein